ncbi:uncharacterized protein PV09_09740 [Verruconis gallopava]|uniref:Uncharacterized protein n=1 Tax=Verruconis gallopava TaxID=253628 RepID=A0A0D1YCN7_9PEZI|nr:uncharacterized protein PV09_09740 [Verruconis gallopava]KIV98441.1 hypothetical protein PV09_09740 [Verruconis gallopava]
MFVHSPYVLTFAFLLFAPATGSSILVAWYTFTKRRYVLPLLASFSFLLVAISALPVICLSFSNVSSSIRFEATALWCVTFAAALTAGIDTYFFVWSVRTRIISVSKAMSIIALFILLDLASFIGIIVVVVLEKPVTPCVQAISLGLTIQGCVGHIFRLLAVRIQKVTIDTCLFGFMSILITFFLVKLQDDYLRIEYRDDYLHLQYRDFFVLWTYPISYHTLAFYLMVTARVFRPKINKARQSAKSKPSSYFEPEIPPEPLASARSFDNPPTETEVEGRVHDKLSDGSNKQDLEMSRLSSEGFKITEARRKAEGMNSHQSSQEEIGMSPSDPELPVKPPATVRSFDSSATAVDVVEDKPEDTLEDSMIKSAIDITQPLPENLELSEAHQRDGDMEHPQWDYEGEEYPQVPNTSRASSVNGMEVGLLNSVQGDYDQLDRTIARL